MRKLLTILLLMSVAYHGWSQKVGCSNNWPSNKAKAEEQLAVYTAALKQQNYRGALPGIQWFLKNAPNWDTKLYVDGADVYNKLASMEKDPSKKQVLVDSLMWMYDERVKRCGDEVTVLNRKATYAGLYNGQNKQRAPEVLALYEKVLDISDVNVSDNVLESYFRMVYSNFMLVRNLDSQQVQDKYQKIQAAIDKKIAAYNDKGKKGEAERLKATKANVDELFNKMVVAASEKE